MVRLKGWKQWSQLTEWTREAQRSFVSSEVDYRSSQKDHETATAQCPPGPAEHITPVLKLASCQWLDLWSQLVQPNQTWWGSWNKLPERLHRSNLQQFLNPKCSLLSSRLFAFQVSFNWTFHWQILILMNRLCVSASLLRNQHNVGPFVCIQTRSVEPTSRWNIIWLCGQFVNNLLSLISMFRFNFTSPWWPSSSSSPGEHEITMMSRSVLWLVSLCLIVPHQVWRWAADWGVFAVFRSVCSLGSDRNSVWEQSRLGVVTDRHTVIIRPEDVNMDHSSGCSQLHMSHVQLKLHSYQRNQQNHLTSRTFWRTDETSRRPLEPVQQPPQSPGSTWELFKNHWNHVKGC